MKIEHINCDNEQGTLLIALNGICKSVKDGIMSVDYKKVDNTYDVKVYLGLESQSIQREYGSFPCKAEGKDIQKRIAQLMIGMINDRERLSEIDDILKGIDFEGYLESTDSDERIVYFDIPSEYVKYEGIRLVTFVSDAEFKIYCKFEESEHLAFVASGHPRIGVDTVNEMNLFLRDSIKKDSELRRRIIAMKEKCVNIPENKNK